jgi:hypothetical protein
MAEVTYYASLCRHRRGIAAGEPTECFDPIAVVVRAEALSRDLPCVGAVAFQPHCESRRCRRF